MTVGIDVQDVHVQVRSFSRLFAESEFPLGLDNYQRPFIWKEEKIQQLIGDLEGYQREQKADGPHLDYYMGALLLHRNQKEEQLYVIDGQQRLTSLCTLYHLITGDLPPSCNFTYRNRESVTNIFSARKRFENAPAVNNRELLDHIVFTVIVVSSEDLAFTFFDTQNNRGVPLNATDLLKAHHLRAISNHNGMQHALQEDCAKRWEKLQGKEQVLRRGSDFAPTLFGQFLWRARRWTGQRQINRETHDDIIAEFQDRSLPTDSPNSVPLFVSHSNRLATHLTLTPKEGYSLNLQAIRLSDHTAAELPFSLRQPIYKGIGFFLYAEKYTELVDQLLRVDHPEPEIRAYARFYQEVIADLSVYLRELFLLASVIYMDQFGFRQLLHFALWLDHVLGAIRLEKSYIFRAAPLIFLRESDHNLLDVISTAFRPEEVIEWLQRERRAQATYESENVDVGKGVRGQYKQRLLRYYEKENTLHGKASWITDKFIEDKKAVLK